MNAVHLHITRNESDEIEAAADLSGQSVDDFISQAVLWVVYNCAEVAGKTPPGVDHYLKNMVESF